MPRFSFFEKFLTPFTIIVFVSALLSSLAAYISPEHSWIIALFGLGFPFIYTINFFFLFFWILKRKKIFILTLIPFLIGIKTVPSFVQIKISSKQASASPSDPLKVMSFNVRLFDLYNWTGNWLGTAKVRENIFRRIKKESPGIICFQEFYHCDSGKFSTIDTMVNNLSYKYSNVVMPISLYKINHWGMAIFSKHPVINKGVIYFNRKGANMCLYADVIVKTDTLRVYNCHLQSIRFKQEDYKFINDLENDKEEDRVIGAKRIFQRLRLAFIKRATQIDTLTAHIKSSPYPVILCGDFNDTPSSYSYSQINNLLKDSFKESGSGISTTYTGPFPAFRIDFIFHSPQLTSSGYRSIKEKLSDHYPLTCLINLKK